MAIQLFHVQCTIGGMTSPCLLIITDKYNLNAYVRLVMIISCSLNQLAIILP